MAYTCNDISTSPVSLGYAREKSASTTVRNYLNFPRIILTLPNQNPHRYPWESHRL